MKTLSTQPPGPLMIDIEGYALTVLDAERLIHPLVGGVILFTRNYRDRQQLTELCAEIHALRTPRLLIAIDHEGGRVQRCREGFSLIPAMQKL
ncbi:MAG: beta-N-acetylhexosaminidase, partial [Rugosibacter sp.]